MFDVHFDYQPLSTSPSLCKRTIAASLSCPLTSIVLSRGLRIPYPTSLCYNTLPPTFLQRYTAHSDTINCSQLSLHIHSHLHKMTPITMKNIARPNKLPSAATLHFPLASPPTPPTTPSPPSGLATKRKAEEDNNIGRKSAKHKKLNPPVPKRKADVSTTTTEIQSVKRRKIVAPDQTTPRELAKSPEAAESFETTLKPAVNFSSTTVATNSTQVRAHTLPSGPSRRQPVP